MQNGERRMKNGKGRRATDERRAHHIMRRCRKLLRDLAEMKGLAEGSRWQWVRHD